MGSKTEVQVGKKFGLWTVLEIEVKNPNSGAKRVRKGALCQCECGNRRYKEYRDLYDGRSTSCGCNGLTNARIAKIKQGSVEPGSVFGYLTVLEDLGMVEGKHLSKCQCACGSIIQVQNHHLKNGHTQSCGCLLSKGELEISKLLLGNNIEYAKQYTFSDLKSKKGGALRFDFAILVKGKLNKLIEFDGTQHYKPGYGYFENTLEDIQNRDKLKEQYCLDNNIHLIRIPYDKLGKITLQDLGIEES